MTIEVPLSSKELIVSAAGVALGAAEIVSPPVAVAVAVSPLVRRGLHALVADSTASGGRTATSERRQTVTRRRRGAPARVRAHTAANASTS